MRQFLVALSAVLAMNGKALAEVPVIAIPQITIAAGTSDNSQLAIFAQVIGLGSGELTATLLVERSDNSGSTQSRQSRQLSVAPGSTDVVGTMQISVKDGFHLHATLTLIAGGATIGTSSTSLGEVAN